MIKKILDWILGKSDSGSNERHPLDGATRVAQERAEAPYKVETPVKETAVEPVAQEVAKVEEAAVAVETEVKTVVAPVTVKAKYKKAELNKKTKKELAALAEQHKLEVKSRATKEELVKALSKV